MKCRHSWYTRVYIPASIMTRGKNRFCFICWMYYYLNMTQTSYYKKHLVETKTFFFKKYNVLYYESKLNDKLSHYSLLGEHWYVEDRYWPKWFRNFPNHISIIFAYIDKFCNRTLALRLLKYKAKILNWYRERFVSPKIKYMLHRVQEDMERNP